MLDLLEQKEVEVGGEKYLITALGALKGLEYAPKLVDADNKLIIQIITECVSHDNMPLSGEKFDKHFSRRYTAIYELFNEIVEFNWGLDVKSPN